MLIIEKIKYETIFLEILEELEKIFYNSKLLYSNNIVYCFKNKEFIAEFDIKINGLLISEIIFGKIYQKINFLDHEYTEDVKDDSYFIIEKFFKKVFNIQGNLFILYKTKISA